MNGALVVVSPSVAAVLMAHPFQHAGVGEATAIIVCISHLSAGRCVVSHIIL